ncbi:heat-inducible transcription repressor [Senna tora]|uniref:Heat-inducible transcription repressor n=1 Tax=Senna tora TaxID=362788 RepID=A0A834XGQ1_9FABA|nr:heat-inducible transcription repressor [Senna tora]
MAYRRRHGLSRSSTFQEDVHHSPPSPTGPAPEQNPSLRTCYSFSPSSSSSSSSPSLAAQAIRASAARRDSSSLSLTYGDSAFASDHLALKGLDTYGDDLGIGEAKSGFWGVLAQKAKSMLEDDMNSPRPYGMSDGMYTSHPTNVDAAQLKQSYQSPENPAIWKGLGAITSSLNHLGDTFEKAFEEGRTMVENKTADLRTQIKLKGSGGDNTNAARPQLQNATNLHETQLKASRDVAMATAAKAKLLLRELKTVKADLAFAKARCAQLEEENKLLRDKEGRDKGQNREDDDLIRLQLETLLAEKARLANENEIYSRENRFLREIVEYHQLTMQDVVYLDEGMEEVAEVCSRDSDGVTRMLSISPSPVEITPSSSPPRAPDTLPKPPQENNKTSVSVSQRQDGPAN